MYNDSAYESVLFLLHPNVRYSTVYILHSYLKMPLQSRF